MGLIYNSISDSAVVHWIESSGTATGTTCCMHAKLLNRGLGEASIDTLAVIYRHCTDTEWLPASAPLAALSMGFVFPYSSLRECNLRRPPINPFHPTKALCGSQIPTSLPSPRSPSSHPVNALGYCSIHGHTCGWFNSHQVVAWFWGSA